MIRKKLGTSALLAVFLAANLAIARPADAGLIEIPCADPQGEEEICCQYCVIFCGCPLE